MKDVISSTKRDSAIVVVIIKTLEVIYFPDIYKYYKIYFCTIMFLT